MYVISAILIIVFFLLLFVAIYFIAEFYVCDSYNCKVFVCGENKGPRGSKAYVLFLLNEFYRDGMWPFPYVGASIITPLCLWLLDICITVKNFLVIFLISFVVIYFLFSFFLHHGLKFVTEYVSDYINQNSPDNNNSGICMNELIKSGNLENNDLPNIPVTFSTPVNIF